MTRRKAELLASSIPLLLGIVLFIAAQYIETGAELSQGADFMPRLCSFLLMILSILLFISKFLSKDAGEENLDERKKGINIKKMIFNTVLLFIYILLLKPIGFVIITALYIFIQMFMFTPKEKQNYIFMVILSAVLPIVIYYLFVEVFQLILPAGLLG